MTALLRPAYVLTFRDPTGGAGKVIRSTTTPGTSTVMHLRVELAMAGAADRLTLDTGQVGSFRPSVGQQVTVELGYTDGQDPQQVTVATVVDADPDLRARRVVGLAAAALLRTHVDRTFESATAGSIVNELAQAAGVDVDKSDDGIDFPAYVIDARRSVYHHIGDLAALCGFDRYVTNEGKLVFAFFTGGRTSHVFEHTKHVLAVQVDRARPPPTRSPCSASRRARRRGTSRGPGSGAT